MGLINYDGEVQLWKSDEDSLSISKIRNKCHCFKCKKSIPSGTYCVGRGWTKFCLECSPKLWEDAKKGFEEMIDFVKGQEEKLKTNKETYEKNNLVAMI